MSRCLSAVALILFALFVSPVVASAQDLIPIGPGTPLVYSNGVSDVYCTLGISGYDSTNLLVGLSAAHCGDIGTDVFIEESRDLGPIGRVVRTNVHLDSAVILLDSSKVRPVNQMRGVVVNEIGAAPRLAQWVCKQGETTGNTCGFSIGHGFARDDKSMSIVCVAEGDSGGPVVVGDRLIGITTDRIPKGLPVAMVPCPTLLLSVDMGALLADLNASPGYGSGFRIS